MNEVVLICPNCKSSLGNIVGGFVTCADSCTKCNFLYPKVRGIPNIIFGMPYSETVDLIHESDKLPSQNSDDLDIPFIREALNSNQLTLELGAGCDSSLNPNLIKTDAYLYSTNIHCLADAHSLPFEDNTFSYVYSLAVFEHLHSPWIAAEEIFRVLKPGGKVYVLTAFMQHLHGYPNHYFNMTVSGLKRIFSSFDIIDCRASRFSSLSEIAYILCDLSSVLKRYPSSNKAIRKSYDKVQKSIKQFCEGIVPASGHLMKNLSNNDEELLKVSPAIEIIALKQV